MSELDNVRKQRNDALDRIAVLEVELAEARARASTYGDKVIELSEKLQDAMPISKEELDRQIAFSSVQ